MNDAAREVLVAAALSGSRQIIGRYHDQTADDGECAMGVLHLAMHADRAAALQCLDGFGAVTHECAEKLWARFGMDPAEHIEVATMNNNGHDFLTIARKVGHDEVPS